MLEVIDNPSWAADFIDLAQYYGIATNSVP
jgi:hypothetical protein